MAKTVLDLADRFLATEKKAQSFVKKVSFMAGANAVIGEVERALDLCEPPYLISVEQAYNRAQNIIKQLKGEQL